MVNLDDTYAFRLLLIALATTLASAGCKNEKPAQRPSASDVATIGSEKDAPNDSGEAPADGKTSKTIAVTEDNARGTAVIKGRVVLAGEADATIWLPVANDPVCEKAHKDRKKKIAFQGSIIYRDQDNAVPYVFVYVKKGIDGKYDVPANAVVLDQKDCRYVPHVFGMIAGQTIDVKNSDKTLHNVHSLPHKNNDFNFPQPNPGVKSLKGRAGFPKPEMGIKIKCDVHPWMNAWCHVMKHPFFDVTKDHVECPKGKEAGRGTFEIGALPAGQYEVTAWHETLGEVSQNVSVADGETKEIVFKFKKPVKAAAAPQEPSRTVVLTSTGEKSPKSCCKKGTADGKSGKVAAK